MSADTPTLTMTGYHGCDADNVPSIKAENFRCSRGEHHWLGEGAYFFTVGFADPSTDAQRWAIAESWDKRTRSRRYTKFSVLRAAINPRNPLDMTQDLGKAKVNYAREEIAKRLRPKELYDDNAIIRWLAKHYAFDVLVQDFFIKMTRERILRIESKFPNVRVVCVRKPDSAIDKTSISITYTGLVPTTYS